MRFEGHANEAKNRQREPFPFAPVATQTADGAYEVVLREVGATRPTRDAVDARVLREVAAGIAPHGDRGIIDRPGDVGGWPRLQTTTGPADSDDDGLPDAWEAAHGLDPNDASDRNGHGRDGGFSNLESYLNELASGTITRAARSSP